MRSYRRWFISAAAGIAAVTAAAAGVSPAHAESNGGVRVMPLGDSITEGTQVPGGYRIGLWQRLTSGGYRVDFTGSQVNGPSSLGDHDHEGHPGWRIDQIDANIVGWLQTYTPHTVLLHIGTNDVLQNNNVAGAPARLSTLIDHITATVPSAEVFVATIIPLSSASQEAAVVTFNAAIPAIVNNKVSAGKHVHLVDMHSALTAADLIDGIHPTAGGYDKMAATWYKALQSVPGSISTGPTASPTPGTTTSPTGSPTTAPPTTAPPTTMPPNTMPPTTTPPAGGRSCTAAYSVVGQWQGGFQASVKVTAAGSAINGWTVTWRYANGQSVTQVWSATISTSASAVTARNVSYNGAIGAGGSTEFGFLGSWNGTNETPALTCTAS